MKDIKKKRMPGFKFAIAGLFSAFKSEKNFRFHIILMILIVLAGFFLNISKTEWLFIIVSIAFVLMSELVNTSIELLVDFISPEYDIKAGKIKDIAAAAVLIAVISAVIVGLIIFVPYIILML